MHRTVPSVHVPFRHCAKASHVVDVELKSQGCPSGMTRGHAKLPFCIKHEPTRHCAVSPHAWPPAAHERAEHTCVDWVTQTSPAAQSSPKHVAPAGRRL